jgi:hypothetical protein
VHQVNDELFETKFLPPILNMQREKVPNVRICLVQLLRELLQHSKLIDFLLNLAEKYAFHSGLLDLLELLTKDKDREVSSSSSIIWNAIQTASTRTQMEILQDETKLEEINDVAPEIAERPKEEEVIETKQEEKKEQEAKGTESHTDMEVVPRRDSFEQVRLDDENKSMEFEEVNQKDFTNVNDMEGEDLMVAVGNEEVQKSDEMDQSMEKEENDGMILLNDQKVETLSVQSESPQ